MQGEHSNTATSHFRLVSSGIRYLNAAAGRVHQPSVVRACPDRGELGCIQDDFISVAVGSRRVGVTKVRKEQQKCRKNLRWRRSHRRLGTSAVVRKRPGVLRSCECSYTASSRRLCNGGGVDAVMKQQLGTYREARREAFRKNCRRRLALCYCCETPRRGGGMRAGMIWPATSQSAMLILSVFSC